MFYILLMMITFIIFDVWVKNIFHSKRRTMSVDVEQSRIQWPRSLLFYVVGRHFIFFVSVRRSRIISSRNKVTPPTTLFVTVNTVLYIYEHTQHANEINRHNGIAINIIPIIITIVITIIPIITTVF